MPLPYPDETRARIAYDLRKKGHSFRGIAKAMRVDSKTVQRWVKYCTVGKLSKLSTRKKVDRVGKHGV